VVSIKVNADGSKLAQKLAELSAKLSQAKTVRVGFLENATYPDGTKVAAVAVFQDYGAPRVGIPPRPFFRNMVAQESPTWGASLAAIMKATDSNADRSLTLMGELIAGQLRESIIATLAPPLSPVTLMLRRMRADNPGLVVTGKTVGEAARRVAAGDSYSGVSTKPLVDTGQLLKSVDYEVTQ
jgi:hypothetical protein